MKANHKSERSLIERWFRDKYKTPTQSALFQEQPYAVWLEEYLADLMHEHDELVQGLRELHGTGGKEKYAGDHARRSRQFLERINHLGRILELPKVVVDTGIERIQAEVAAGRKPREMQAVEDHIANLVAKGVIKQTPDGRLA